MSYGRAYAFSTLAVVAVLALPANGQSVVSTRSGVVHFFEGAVYLGGEPLEPRLGRFPNIAEGAELRTAEGRAEVLLTPGVFLRLGARSAIRMASNDLADTRVEMLAGSAIVNSSEPVSGTSVTIVYKDWKVRFPQKGIYRFDAEPPRLWVHQGEAEVSAGGVGAPVSVEQGMYLPFASVLVPERSLNAPTDALSDWARGRGESISADNAITAQIDEDPATRDSGLGVEGFTYFPLIGIPSAGLGSGLYGSYTPYQPGFNSIYLPGYTYMPPLLGFGSFGFGPRGLGSYRYTPPRIGVSPGIGAIGLPRAPLGRPAPVRPIAPPMRPMAPPARAMPHGVVHGVGHR